MALLLCSLEGVQMLSYIQTLEITGSKRNLLYLADHALELLCYHFYNRKSLVTVVGQIRRNIKPIKTEKDARFGISS